jgi:hypothetical protein
MSRHAGAVNEGQVISERIEAMVTPTGAPVKIVTELEARRQHRHSKPSCSEGWPAYSTSP